MSLRSTIARPTLTPALNVFSVTAPVLTFRSFERTKAPPLPGFTCWNSMIWNSVPSSSRVIPFLKSFVETLTVPVRLQLEQLSRRRAQHAASVVGDLHGVLDANAAQARQVHARFHGDDRPGRELVGELETQPRALVDLQPDAVAEPVGERLSVPRLLDGAAHDAIDLASRDPGPDGVDTDLLRLPHDVVNLPKLRRRLAE